MTALDYILDGLEAELALERELGVRTVEIDRALLAPMADGGRPAPGAARQGSSGRAPAPSGAKPTPPGAKRPFSFAFLHDGPLSPGGVEMMGKIVAAMGKTPETAPVACAGERPSAKVYVVLGTRALKKWFPTLRGAPGQWLKGPGGEPVLATYSPEDILRFGAVTPELTKLKRAMWTSLKGVMQRVGT